MQTGHDRKSRRHTRMFCGALTISLIAALWTAACASSPEPPTTALCVRPTVTPCQRPAPPARLETQADLLAAYVDALAAWASCKVEVDKVIEYYRLLEGNNAE